MTVTIECPTVQSVTPEPVQSDAVPQDINIRINGKLEVSYKISTLEAEQKEWETFVGEAEIEYGPGVKVVHDSCLKKELRKKRGGVEKDKQHFSGYAECEQEGKRVVVILKVTWAVKDQTQIVKSEIRVLAS